MATPQIYYKDGGSWKSALLNSYPVGSIFMSYTSTSPANLFGGNWTPISGRFLYCNNGTSTGGANSRTYNFNHNHAMTMNKKNSTGSWAYALNQQGIGYHNGDAAVQDGPILTSTSASMSAITQGESNGPRVSMGGNTPLPLGNKTIDTMPAYQTVYCWRRTS